MDYILSKEFTPSTMNNIKLYFKYVIRMNNNLLNIFSNKNRNIPIWIMRQAGRYLPEYLEVRQNIKSFLDLCYNSELASEVTLQPLRRFKLDAAIIFSDILTIPNSMGISVEFKENHGPILKTVKTESELKEVLLKKDLTKLSFVYNAIKLTKAQLSNNTSLIGFAGAPWTLAAYIIEGKLSKDLGIVKKAYYNDPAFFDKLINVLVENIAKHLLKQIEFGADVIQIFDSWAGFVTAQDFEELIIKPTQKIINLVRQVNKKVPIICFPRMSGFNYEKFCDLVDCQAIGVDQYIDLKWVKKIKNQKIIQGNLEPIVLASNSKNLIKERVDGIFEAMEGENFIFNLGHGIVPYTPVDNVEFLVNYVKEKSNNSF